MPAAPAAVPVCPRVGVASAVTQNTRECVPAKRKPGDCVTTNLHERSLLVFQLPLSCDKRREHLCDAQSETHMRNATTYPLATVATSSCAYLLVRAGLQLLGYLSLLRIQTHHSQLPPDSHTTCHTITSCRSFSRASSMADVDVAWLATLWRWRASAWFTCDAGGESAQQCAHAGAGSPHVPATWRLPPHDVFSPVPSQAGRLVGASGRRHAQPQQRWRAGHFSWSPGEVWTQTPRGRHRSMAAYPSVHAFHLKRRIDEARGR